MAHFTNDDVKTYLYCKEKMLLYTADKNLTCQAEYFTLWI